MSNERVVFLTDGVVTLRPVLKADVPFFLACVNDPQVRYYIDTYLPQMEEDEEKWLTHLSENKQTNIVLAIEAESSLIGVMGIHRINWKDRVGTTGAMIKGKGNRGKGYGTRAKMLLLHYAFHDCNFHKICSMAYDFNKASLGFNAKCGYKQEGILRRHVYKNGEYRDCVVTAVFREDFEPLWLSHKEKHGIEI